MNKKIASLLKLLDDENQQTASQAMAELLSYDEELDPLLKELQESENHRLRKRVHQLESILIMRRRRKNLASCLKKSNPDLIEGLVELHIQWYDNDSERGILSLWEELLNVAEKYQMENIEKLAYFMRKQGFSATEKEEIDADAYCLGIVLDDLCGADVILCSLAREIAKVWDLELEVVHMMGEFALIDQNGHVLFPGKGWQIMPQVKTGTHNTLDSRMLLKFITSILFLCAVSTDSFRYVSTVGSCLAEASGMDSLEILPYPYNF